MLEDHNSYLFLAPVCIYNSNVTERSVLRVRWKMDAEYMQDSNASILTAVLMASSYPDVFFNNKRFKKQDSTQKVRNSMFSLLYLSLSFQHLGIVVAPLLSLNC